MNLPLTHAEKTSTSRLPQETYDMLSCASFLDPEGSLSATTVVLVLVVTRFRKMPKALRNGKLRNFAYTFVTSFPTDLPS